MITGYSDFGLAVKHQCMSSDFANHNVYNGAWIAQRIKWLTSDQDVYSTNPRVPMGLVLLLKSSRNVMDKTT